MPTVAFTTLGCRLNQAESDSMADELCTRGFDKANSAESPDVVVINTCTVTREATKASRSAIRRAVRDNPGSKVVAIGCYAVSNPEEVEAIEGVDVVLGNTEKERFAEALGTCAPTAPLLQVGFRRKGPPRAASSKKGKSDAPDPAVSGIQVRANLKVQTGCDEWCTFCIIPTTRGHLRSMDEESLVAQARAKVAAGARELVLTGVHLGKYSYDQGGDERDLVRLCRRLLRLDGVRRLRLSSILSRHLTPELVDFMAGEPRMCRYLHVPLQAGDDTVLAAMNRPYRIGEYVESVTRAKGALPGLALATDVIVGFPGESEEAFSATMDVVSNIEFCKLHVFRYSARPDTPAAEMASALDPEVRKERSKRLTELGNEIRSRFLNEHLQRRLQVLVEDERVVENVTICSGQTDDHVRVWFEGRGLLGSIVDVEGVRLRADGLEGRPAR